MSIYMVATIQAGAETGVPSDNPSSRLDTGNTFTFVGALEVSDGASTFHGSGVALSANWILTAAHNTDLNDDGQVDATWTGTFHLPGYGAFTVDQAYTHADFTGFANPVVNDDLALLHLATPLSGTLPYPILGTATTGDMITLVGFGRSGYGSYGYTSNATLTDRRYGSNVIDTLGPDDEGSGLAEVFRYDFDAPSTTGLSDGSLGNDIETIIGPGDSGGPALKQTAAGWEVVGINTFTEGYGGKFGDTGGGVLTEPYRDWIQATMNVPEPGSSTLIFCAVLIMTLRRQRVFCS